MLYLSLGRSHGGCLGSAGNCIKFCGLGPEVHQHKADVGLVSGDRGHTCIQVNVIVQGQIVVAVGGAAYIFLSEDGVDVAVLEQAVVIQLGDDQVGIIKLVDPLGNLVLLIIIGLAGNGVHKDRSVDVFSAPPADAVLDGGSDPVRRSLVVDLKGDLFKHFCRIEEADMAVDVPEEVLAGRVFHSIFQPYQVCLLGHHVHGDIGGQSLFLVIEPFNGIGVGQRGHPVGDPVVVDLGVVVFDLKLGYQLCHLTQLPASQTGGRILIHHRDLVHTDLSHIGREIPGLHLDQIPVPGSVKERDADGRGCHHQDHQDADEAKADL